MGAAGEWTVERVTAEAAQKTLQPDTWSEPSRDWATVTPVLLDTFPKDAYGPEAQQIVATACERIGLPRPVQVAVGPVSAVLGVPPWHSFLGPRRAGKPVRLHAHAILRFAAPVRGPILLGAGRYRGLGLCRPLVKGFLGPEGDA